MKYFRGRVRVESILSFGISRIFRKDPDVGQTGADSHILVDVVWTEGLVVVQLRVEQLQCCIRQDVARSPRIVPIFLQSTSINSVYL